MFQINISCNKYTKILLNFLQLMIYIQMQFLNECVEIKKLTKLKNLNCSVIFNLVIKN